MSAGDLIRIFNGGVAIITGGASGIGRGFGEALAAQGCEVVLADLQIDLAREAADGINASGGKATAVEVDVVDREAVVNVVQQTVERCDRLDYMFNNAGIVVFGEASEFEMRDWEQSIDVNLRGVIHGVDAAYRVMLEQGFGHIVNTASIAGLMPWPMEIGYTATKHAVVGLTTALRAEAAHAGVRASVLCPGLVQTPIIHGGKYGRWIRDYPIDKVTKLMESTKPYPLDKFVPRALKQIARNKPIIIIPLMYRVLWRMYRISPLFGMALSRMMFHAMRKELNKIQSSH
jgi:NAD(P)-dependent dehydrogenase (short-subunit alcohol dehydrogenase family)